ncbi:emp24/gp25L/p24 family/GOLD-domain-containing protein [Phlebopus sp. FC_14]|nr:emp24/gp25L/p24 family/GOLD-domain-containing protein [Phlebopus sp. FC_14]
MLRMLQTRRTPWLAFLCVSFLFMLPTLISAHMINVEASKKECFFEDLHEHDQMTVTYQVGEGGHLDIDFWLTDPEGEVLTKQIRHSTGSTSITAEKDGRYEYCFSNQMSTMADKQVSFNVHGIIYIPEDADIVAPVEREIRSLAIGLLAVKDEQEYIVVRERRHRDTAESTNDRVKWWSVLQAVVLFSVVAWQVYYLKSFFEVKRII